MSSNLIYHILTSRSPLLFAATLLLCRTGHRCSQCKAPRKATVKTSLTALPPYLVLQLKRFTETGRKLPDFVDFPVSESWDLAPWLSLDSDSDESDDSDVDATESGTAEDSQTSQSNSKSETKSSSLSPAASVRDASTCGGLSKNKQPTQKQPKQRQRGLTLPGGGAYELAAVVHHVGGVGGGHYTASIKVRVAFMRLFQTCVAIKLLAFH